MCAPLYDPEQNSANRMGAAMQGYRYDSTYEELAVLNDGTMVRLRLVRPSDADLLVEGFEHLSEESRQQRFLSAKSRLTPKEIKYLTHVDGEHHLAIAALTRNGEHGLGVARFIRLDEPPDTADVAITVIDEAQHKGLGYLLLMRLFEAGRERNVAAFHFDVMADNRPMLALLHSLAPGVTEHITSGIATIEIPLDRVARLDRVAQHGASTAAYNRMARGRMTMQSMRTRPFLRHASQN